MPKPRVVQVIDEFRAGLLAQDAAQMREMARRWLEVERRLEGLMLDLSYEIDELRAAGKSVKAWKIYRLERYQQLLAQARAETEKYDAWAADLIASNQRSYARDGLSAAQAAIDAAYQDAGVTVGFFNRLPVAAVESMAGYAADGTPLLELLQASYPETAKKITETLINSVSAGFNPRKTARLMADDMAGNLDRALLISRTEQLRAYRAASQQQFIESGVVSGYMRSAAKSPRTCAACLALDGKIYPTDTLMELHPADRCSMTPLLKDYPPPRFETGQEWFEKQKPEVQREILGAGRFDAWREGKFEFSRLAKVHHDDTWGDGVSVRPLGELVR